MPRRHPPDPLTADTQTVRAVAASEPSLWTTFTYAPVGMAHIGLDAHWLLVNQRLYAMLGYPSDELLDRTLDDITPREDMAAYRAAVNQILVGASETVRLEQRAIRADDAILWVQLALSLVRDAAGAPDYLIAVIEDITERKQQEAALRTHQPQLDHQLAIASFYQTAPVGLCFVDADLRYVQVNDYFAAIYGIPAAAHIGRTVRDLLPPAVADRVEEIVRQVIATGQPILDQVVHIPSPAQALAPQVTASEESVCDPEIPIQPSAQPHLGRYCLVGYHPVVQADGTPIGVSVVVQDITERRQAEVVLQEREWAYATVLRNIAGMTYRCRNDNAWTMELVSDGCLALTGCPAEDLIENQRVAFGDLIHPDDAGPLWEKCQATLAAQRLCSNEYRISTAQGEEKWVWDQAHGIYASDGELLAVEGIIMDITDRKRLEEELREREAQFRLLMTHSLDAVLLTAPNGQILAANTAATQMFGYTEEELCAGGRNLIIDTTDPRLAPALAERTRTGIFRGELNFRRRDGTIFPVEISSALFYDRHGNARTSLIIRDVTGRKQAETALRESEARFRTLIRDLHVGVLLQGPQAEILLSNQAALDLLGLTEEQLLGKTSFDPDWNVIHEDGSPFPGPTHPVPQALATRRPMRNVVMGVYRPTTCDRVWLLVNAEPQLADDGSVRHVICSFSDITDRKRTEETLQASEQRYAALIAHTWEAIVLVSPTGQLLYASPTTPRILGYTPEELTRFNAFDLIHPDDAAAVTERLQTALSHPGVMVEVATRVRNKAGEWRYMEGILNNLLDDEAIGAIVNNYRDVTEQRKLQEQFLQAQKMEVVGQLAGGVAHDFNNLLTAINGYAELVLADLPPDVPLRADLLEIRKAADRATALTRQLLTFARRQLNDPRVLNINELLHDLDKLLRRLIREDITLVITPGPNLASVSVDPSQFEQVIINLVVNARDAMPQGGTLTIETANAELDSTYTHSHPDTSAGQYVMLAVSDTGVGMSAEVQAHIFEPFFTTKPVGQGTGLGLATCYGIIKQHGGTIWVYSEVDHGTVMKVYLPQVAEQGVARPVEVEPDRLPQGTETVLVVEDAEAVRALAVRILRSCGYTVLEAADGVEALRIIQTYAPVAIHLLLTDVVMPRMNGATLAAQVSASYPNLKVLFMSGYTEHSSFRESRLGVGSAVLQKPFAPATLARSVRALLETV